jgi:hypothetical protein
LNKGSKLHDVNGRDVIGDVAVEPAQQTDE